MFREPEQKQGLIFSIAIHFGLLALLMLSSFKSPSPSLKGIAIQAEIMDMDKYFKKPKTQKIKPVEKKPQPETKKPEPEKKQPEPVIKPNIDKTKLQQKKQQKTERQKKLEALREKRKKAEENRKKQQEHLQNIEQQKEKVPEPEKPIVPVGTEVKTKNIKNSLKALYEASIKATVTRQWARPPVTKKGLSCVIKVSQIPGGGVVDVTIGSPCNAGSTVVKNSILNAVRKADPLPYSGFESEFQRLITFTFTY